MEDDFEYEYESTPEIRVENELAAATGCIRLFLVIVLVILFCGSWMLLR